MKTLEHTGALDPIAKAELQQACDKLAAGIPFTAEEKANARARMNQLREENRKLWGEQKIAVELIRETRDNA